MKREEMGVVTIIPTSEEERRAKLEQIRLRRNAVKAAWERERNYVKQGRGTIDWTPAQQKEMLEHGSVLGYEGQHMKSISKYPEYAGDVNNIQLLSHEDHLAAHNYGHEQGGYRNPTNGRYNPKTKTMHDFGDNPPRPPYSKELSNARYQNAREFNKNKNGRRHELEQSQQAGRELLEHSCRMRSGQKQSAPNRGRFPLHQRVG